MTSPTLILRARANMLSIEELGIVFLAEISGFMKKGLKVPLKLLLIYP